MNIPENIKKEDYDGLIVHLVNLTGFSGNTYFNPLPIHDIEFKIRTEIKPKRVFSMVNQQTINYTAEEGYIKFSVDTLDAFDGIVFEK
jgi:hypothetical protein